MLDLQTKVTRVRSFTGALEREVALEDICYKPLEPASRECGVFSPLEYLQSNATLLDAVVRQTCFLHVTITAFHTVQVPYLIVSA